MKDTTKPVRKERKAKRRGGVLRGCKRITKGITALVLAVACAAFAFTQLGFVGLGWNGEYSAYLVAELVPVAVAALLLGPLVGLCMGAFAGAMLLVHATFMPLNFYELTFVTPLTSVVMLGVTGWILGCLFKFALRNDPSLLRGSIYIVIICVIVSWLYSIGFLVNAIISMVYDLASRAQHLSYEQTSQLTNEKLSSMILRMGHLGLQAWAMLLSCRSAALWPTSWPPKPKPANSITVYVPCSPCVCRLSWSPRSWSSRCSRLRPLRKAG